MTHNILMIGLGDDVLTRPQGETRRRHAVYGERAGHLTMLVYGPTAPPGGSLTPHLAAHPVRGPRAFFPLLAVWAGLRHARRPVHLITTQDPFSTGLAGVLLSWLLRAPLLVQNHSTFFDNAHWLAQKPLRHGVFNRLGKWVIRQAALNRVVNHGERAKYLALGVPPERVRVIPLANPAPFAAPVPEADIAAVRRAWGVSPEALVVLWVGRPVGFKRLPTLLDVMARVVQSVPEARLVLVGDMSASAEDLPSLIRARGLADHVLLPGRADFAALPAVYRAGDVYVHTSAYEGLGRVMLEAGASGLPVVAMDSDGAREIVRDGENGFLLPQGDVDGFAARVVELLRDPARRRAMGARGRDLALTRFDPDRLLDDLMAAWRDAADFTP